MSVRIFFSSFSTDADNIFDRLQSREEVHEHEGTVDTYERIQTNSNFVPTMGRVWQL